MKKFYKTLKEMDKDLEGKERDNGSGSSRKISLELMSRHHPPGEWNDKLTPQDNNLTSDNDRDF